MGSTSIESGLNGSGIVKRVSESGGESEVLLASARHPNAKRQRRLKRRTGLRDVTAQRE
jgi:hypothetical protein